MIMDDVLESGAREVAKQQSLMYYESHRHQENIMCAISAYIKNDIPLCRSLLEKTSTTQLLKSDKIQRFRMVVLLYILLLLSHMPYSSQVARKFYNRWHNKS